MAWTQAQVDAFEKALADARGAKTITFEGQSVTFHSLAEAREFLADMKRQVGSTPSHRFAVTSKGT